MADEQGKVDRIDRSCLVADGKKEQKVSSVGMTLADRANAIRLRTVEGTRAYAVPVLDMLV
ncbi:MAG: hypothetical protein WKG01_08845 [Kofleriaceae bacterium]